MSGHTMFAGAELRRFKFAVAASASQGDDLGHLYALAFDSGMTKVGRTSSVQSRIATHVATAAKHGASPLVAWISKPHVNVTNNESSLIKFCAKNAPTRLSTEHFAGLDFTAVVDYAETLPFHGDRRTWLAAIRAANEAERPPVAAHHPVRDVSQSVFDGAALRRLMTVRGVKVQTLADQVGVDRGTLFRLRRGDGNPTFSVVVAIAAFLGVPVDAFVKDFSDIDPADEASAP